MLNFNFNLKRRLDKYKEKTRETRKSKRVQVIMLTNTVKVKQSRYRPGVAQRVPGS
jgi:hypothetical protein